MRRIRSRNTAPELAVRRILRDIGFSGYRIHRSDLPGKPDIAYLSRRKAIFVHGCFWHGHDCREGVRKPRTNRQYWIPKIERNRNRDKKQMDALTSAGWNVLVIWECEVAQMETLANRLQTFMETDTSS